MTPYMEIYERFLSKIRDLKLLRLTDEEVADFCHSLMLAAVVKIDSFSNDLSLRDDEEQCFTSELLDVEKEAIALQMVAEWLDPQINCTLLINQMVGSSEEKFYAQSTHLSALIALRDSNEYRAARLRRNYILKNSSYFKEA